MTKTEIRKWLKRIREDVRLIEGELSGTNDVEWIIEYANDISGAACQIAETLENERNER